MSHILTFLATLATKTTALALPASALSQAAPQNTTTTTAVYYQGGNPSSACTNASTPVSSGLLTNGTCQQLMVYGLGIDQLSDRECNYVLYRGSTDCDGDGSTVTRVVVPVGNESTCIDAGVYDGGMLEHPYILSSLRSARVTMDASNTPQTVAQAVAAATAAAQAAAHASPAVQPVSNTPSSTIDNLTCQWQGCGERTDTAEALYDHVCEKHVGRKSTNNLNLTCQWGACRTTTVKRDHITSHIRVHVPLKPHKCDFCGKSFKRPQDLKKHVKTHADDSVLAASPGTLARALNPNGAQSSYYPSHDNSMHNPYSGYQTGLGQPVGNGNGYAPAASHGQYGGNYGSVSYPTSANVQDVHSMDTRRRAIEALNDFLGDIKRRAINPSSYYDVGHRLNNGGGLPLPVSGGYNTGYSGSNTGASFGNLNAASLLDSFNQGNENMGSGGLGGVMSQAGYALPMSNARTKNDLQDIDRFLEQLQQTVYETSNHSAVAGVQQPGVHAQYAGDYNMGNHYQSRSSGSPPSFQQGTGSSLGAMTATSMPGLTSSSSAMDTPALTPASVSSYSSSGQSPMSNHGRSSMGSASGNVMYPNLPSVTGMSDLGSGYPVTSSAPASSLASGFEGLDGRRYSGGRLQRQAPAQDTEMRDAEDGAKTPRPEEPSHAKPKSDSNIDPELRGEASPEGASTPAARSEEADKRQEDWVENIRTIESLRKWISERLTRGDFEIEGEIAKEDARAGAEDSAAARIQAEIAKMVQAKMGGAPVRVDERPVIVAGEDAKYPTLPLS
ncbi:hypothetical protein LTR62_007858 [Meristemomyces frigidus]|uniref:C2H2-type domain-containing protein n=1 Tax=Meristemomyces frigidus TaxID=1508187 RepID=A0AAN7YHH2_9PEZI|nr:hypothetical protein LTR62_007858 [Meristemomyces frigidus]